MQNTFTWADENTLHQHQTWDGGKRKAFLVFTVVDGQMKLVRNNIFYSNSITGVWRL